MRRAWAVFERHDGFKQTAIVLVALGVYETARSLIEPDWGAAIANAERIAELERGLSFAWEQSLQRAFPGVPELVEAMNVFYFVGHFVLTGVFFLWLYRSSSEGFRSFRKRVHRGDRDRGGHPLVVPDCAAACRRRPRDHGHASRLLGRRLWLAPRVGFLESGRSRAEPACRLGGRRWRGPG